MEREAAWLAAALKATPGLQIAFFEMENGGMRPTFTI
jgi:hypothetical protein